MYVKILIIANNKVLKYNHGEKSMKVSFIIYADLESLLEKINIHLLVIHRLHTVHLIQQKTCSIIIEVKIV